MRHATAHEGPFPTQFELEDIAAGVQEYVNQCASSLLRVMHARQTRVVSSPYLLPFILLPLSPA
jgi:hypothetical protein